MDSVNKLEEEWTKSLRVARAAAAKARELGDTDEIANAEYAEALRLFRAADDAVVAHLVRYPPRTTAPAEFKFPEVFCSQCGEAFGPGDNGFSHCENHKGMFPTEPNTFGPADWAEWQAELYKSQAEAIAEIAEKRRYLRKSKKPAEDLWSAILAAQVKMGEATECFLDLSEMAWELVLAEQQRAKRARGLAQLAKEMRNPKPTKEKPDAT